MCVCIYLISHPHPATKPHTHPEHMQDDPLVYISPYHTHTGAVPSTNLNSFVYDVYGH